MGHPVKVWDFSLGKIDIDCSAQKYDLKVFCFTHEITTARMTCLLSRGVLKRLDMFLLLPSAFAFWYWAFAMIC